MISRLAAQALTVFSIILICSLSPAMAQTASAPEHPKFPEPDEFGVDLVNANFMSVDGELNIGGKENGLNFVRRNSESNYDLYAKLYFDNGYNQPYTKISIKTGLNQHEFIRSGSIFNSRFGDGATLSEDQNGFILLERDGTKISISKLISISYGMAVTKIERPNGNTEIINYKTDSYYSGSWQVYISRIQSIVNNFGFMLKIGYSSNSVSASTVNDWSVPVKISGINRSFDFCDPVSDTCSYSASYPQVQLLRNPVSPANTGSGYSTWTMIVTDPNGGQTIYSKSQQAGNINPPRAIGIVRPGMTTPSVVYGYNGVGVSEFYVSNATLVSGLTNTYTWTFSGTSPAFVLGGSSIDSLGRTRTVATNGISDIPRIVSDTDSLNRTTSYSYDSFFRTTLVTHPEGNKEAYTYDGRGNVLTLTISAKQGSGQSDLVAQASYPTACVNVVTCNKPDSSTDAAGKITNYTYDAVHGGMTVKALPPPTAGSARPTSRYSYVQRFAWIKNADGSYSQADSPVWLLANEKTCKNGATIGNECAQGAADEVVTSYDYGPDFGPNNLFLRGRSISSNGVTFRTCYAYDQFGNKISETTPNASLTSCP